MKIEEKIKRLEDYLNKLKCELDGLKDDLNPDYTSYTITFNGEDETVFISNEAMTFDESRVWIADMGRKPIIMVDLFEKDNDGKTRLEHLSDIGFDKWIWVEENPVNSKYAFSVNPSSGYVYYYYRTYNLYSASCW